MKLDQLRDTLLTSLMRMQVSVDVSTGDDDYRHRIFGVVTGIQVDGKDELILLVEETSRNF